MDYRYALREALEMISYILSNMEWIFSGIGVFVIGLIITFLTTHRKRETTQPRPVAQLPVQDAETVSRMVQETESEKIARRFNLVLERMNEGRHYQKFSIPRLAQLMQVEKISDLEDVFLGKEEPTLQFMAAFCQTFGVNKTWLIEGKGSPFKDDDYGKGDPLAYFEDIEQLEPHGIYFIRARTDTAQAFIILRLSDWKYKILNRMWHISDRVGAGGQGQLLSMYRLINKLRASGYYGRCGGRTLSKKEFDSLLAGDVFPGKYLDVGPSEDPWWDDLTDVYHKYPIASGYGGCHGKSFLQAQQIIKLKLEGVL